MKEDKVEEFMQSLREGYAAYEQFRGEGGKLKEGMEEKWKEVVFATKPSSGACGECFSSMYPFGHALSHSGSLSVYKFEE